MNGTHNIMLNRSDENGHSFLFPNFVKESFQFSALPCGIWPLLSISAGSLAQAGFLLLPQGKMVLASPLVSGLVPFPGISGLPPAADCCCFLPGAGPMVGARRMPLLPSGTDSFASTLLSVQVTWLPLPGTISWGVSWPFSNNLMVLLHMRESQGST